VWSHIHTFTHRWCIWRHTYRGVYGDTYSHTGGVFGGTHMEVSVGTHTHTAEGRSVASRPLVHPHVMVSCMLTHAQTLACAHTHTYTRTHTLTHTGTEAA